MKNKNFVRLREAKNMTQVQVAKELGICKDYVNMIEGLAKVATGFAMISEGINEIILNAQANDSSKLEEGKVKEAKTKEKAEEITNKSVEKKVEISKEDVRAVLAKKSQDGKTKDVKALLNKYGAEKLTSVKPEDYEKLLKEAEVL